MVKDCGEESNYTVLMFPSSLLSLVDVIVLMSFMILDSLVICCLILVRIAVVCTSAALACNILSGLWVYHESYESYESNLSDAS